MVFAELPAFFYDIRGHGQAILDLEPVDLSIAQFFTLPDEFMPVGMEVDHDRFFGTVLVLFYLMLHRRLPTLTRLR